MGIQKIILNIILTIENIIILPLRIKKNRVTFISLESLQLESDFKLIYDELKKEDIDIKLCLIHYQKNLKGQFLYFLNCIKQLYLIQTSRLVILHDNNYVVSHFKRKDVQVLQVWHACGAIKKFGNVIDRQYPIANYDYVLSTSSYWKSPYSLAFDVKEDNVLPLGLPRTDHLFNQGDIQENRDKLYQKYPILKDKKIILYAPTFRGNIYKGFTSIDFDAQKIINTLGDDYLILYKFHPLLKNYQIRGDSRIINMNHEDTHALFCISDYLISDYSSIVFDFMILEKPIIFFTPDLKEYTEDLGVFVNIHKLNCPVCNTEEDICNAILNTDFNCQHIQQLKKQFFDMCDGKSVKRVTKFIKTIVQ